MPGQVVKARMTLKELREACLEAARTLGRTESRNATLSTENGAIEKSNANKRIVGESLDKQIVQKRQELGILDDAVEGKRYVVIMLDDSIETSAISLEDIEYQTRKLLDQLSVLEYENDSADKNLQGKELLRQRFEKDVRELIGRKISLENAVVRLLRDLDKAVAKKEGVFGAIEEALANFRVFERRIAQFTEDTGYIVGYDRPDTLLDNE